MKKVYAVIESRGVEYAAHITEREAYNHQISGAFIRLISKSEYQALRTNGMPSYGQYLSRLAGMYHPT